MIVVQKVDKAFDHICALHQVSIQIAEREIYGLVGPDGAGKTTLLRIICGLMKPDRGLVEIAGLSPSRLKNGQLGYMPQRFSLYPDLTVDENISFFASLYGLERKLYNSRAADILQLTGLLPFRQRLAEQLSGGMKQKLALTCALVTRPRLLILDEPTYGVDPQSRQEFWQILYELSQQGTTVLVTTPYMDEAELCNRVGFIDQGRILAENSPYHFKERFSRLVLEVRTSSRDPYLFAGQEEVVDSSFYGYKYRLILPAQDERQGIGWVKGYLASLDLGGQVETSRPTMEDIFISLCQGGGSNWTA